MESLVNEHIAYCFQCECYYTHIGYERIEGGRRLKNGVSYCRHGKKYRKLGVRESTKGVAPGCPKRLPHTRFRIYRKEENLFDLLMARDLYHGTFRQVYEGQVDTDCVEDLRGYLFGEKEAQKHGCAIHVGDVVTLFNGLNTTAWVLDEAIEFEPVNFYGDFILKRSA